MANAGDKKILCIAVCAGSVHDFALFKRNQPPVGENVRILGDSGYQGIASLHANSETPIKATKLHPLCADEKSFNRDLAKRRIYIEHINRHLKIFRIVSSRYRNARKRFGLRISLICGIYNFQL